MNNETTTQSPTVKVTMTLDEWGVICEAIICGIGARDGLSGIVVDKEQAQKMRDIYWSLLKVEY